VRVLQDVSLDLGEGEVLAVLAQRAQGKTSLLRVAAGIQRPDQGSVLFEGQDLWSLSERKRSRLLAGHIGWAASAVPALDVPMLANVALPLFAACGKREAYKRATAALERVGAPECAEQFWGSLADWERALAAIAQGIARDPKLLLVDDLTASLGLDEAVEVAHLLDSLAKERGLGVLMSVSDANSTSWSGRVATLAGGRLIEAPTPPRERDNIIDFPRPGHGGSDPMHGVSS
jgi:ABC-type cobalamin/Fe3+-siderophores transport system ATPase subunit